MVFMGIDIGSSSINVSLLDGETGRSLASAAFPPVEMEIISTQGGWAEQHPEVWMDNLLAAVDTLKPGNEKVLQAVGAIGITYQMHGLVAVDKEGVPLRNAIIWCDSRAVSVGVKAFAEMGNAYCLNNLLNSPGNFTASKLKWVSTHEPELYEKIDKIMLPGDYVAYRLTGEITTTASGLSEGIFWDYERNGVSDRLMDYYDFSGELLPPVYETFSIQGLLAAGIAGRMGLKAGTPVSYRAGDQPNNAFSLNVLNPGEVAATAGTSGVVYGVTDQKKYDPLSRVNTFLHVNNSKQHPRLGVLLCLNATGILNSWSRHQLVSNRLSYEEMNELAMQAPPGAEGLLVLPFGNGAERMLGNRQINASISGLQFNKHNQSHLLRAIQEGIVFSLNYGLEVMKGVGLDLSVIRAGEANMFLSKLFRSTFADLTGAHIELYKTDGAEGAARGAGLGIGYYRDSSEAFRGLKHLTTIEPQHNPVIAETYQKWRELLTKTLEDYDKLSGS
jgi:xylulokinase